MLHEQFEHQNAANTRENERFQLNNVANAFEMAASSSKLLQIAWKMDGNGNQKKTKRKKQIPKQFQTQYKLIMNNGNYYY
jgi:hypothetical protein